MGSISLLFISLVNCATAHRSHSSVLSKWWKTEGKKHIVVPSWGVGRNQVAFDFWRDQIHVVSWSCSMHHDFVMSLTSLLSQLWYVFRIGRQRCSFCFSHVSKLEGNLDLGKEKDYEYDVISSTHELAWQNRGVGVCGGGYFFRHGVTSCWWLLSGAWKRWIEFRASRIFYERFKIFLFLPNRFSGYAIDLNIQHLMGVGYGCLGHMCYKLKLNVDIKRLYAYVYGRLN